MDPLTQGLLGAAAAQAAVGGKLPRAWLVGLLSGMAADLDVFIRSASDPLFAVEFHRHFTHALLFIPVGAALCTLPWLVSKFHRQCWRSTFLASFAAYATHGLLDACTSYGTQLLWPFSNQRAGWDWIAIIDPIFTLALLFGVLHGGIKRARTGAIAGLAVALAYLGIGVWQHSRALGVQKLIAEARGHAVDRGQAFPTIGNQLVWRSLYRSGETLHVDRIRVPWFGEPTWSPGSRVPLVELEDLGVAERTDERVVRDFRRFAWFSDGWVARSPSDPSIIGDVRYSLRTDSFEPIWGVRFAPGTDAPTEWVSRSRDRNLRLSDLWSEIDGTHPAYRPVGPDASKSLR